MKNKIILFFMIGILLLGVVFVNSYVQALSNEDIIEQKVNNNSIIKEKYIQIYKDIESGMINCYNNCQQNENCQMYQQNGNCMYQNNQCYQKSYNCINNCAKQQNCIKKACNR